MTPPDGSARPLSRRERAVLLEMERSLDAVPALPRDRRRWMRPVARIGALTVLVVALLGVLAALAGQGGFDLGVVGLGAVLFGVTLRDVLTSASV